MIFVDKFVINFVLQGQYMAISTRGITNAANKSAVPDALISQFGQSYYQGIVDLLLAWEECSLQSLYPEQINI